MLDPHTSIADLELQHDRSRHHLIQYSIRTFPLGADRRRLVQNAERRRLQLVDDATHAHRVPHAQCHTQRGYRRHSNAVRHHLATGRRRHDDVVHCRERERLPSCHAITLTESNKDVAATASVYLYVFSPIRDRPILTPTNIPLNPPSLELYSTGRLKMQDRKMTDRKMTDKSAGLENAGLENDGQKCRAGK